MAGIKNELDANRVEAAIRGRDPAAIIKIDRARGMVDVTSVNSAADLCDAIQDVGFIAKPVKSVPGMLSFRDTARLLLRALLFGVLGALGSAIVGVGAGVLNLETNSECWSPTDEGACAMGIPLFAIGFGFVGGGICGAITLVRGGIRLHHAWRLSRQAAL